MITGARVVDGPVDGGGDGDLRDLDDAGHGADGHEHRVGRGPRHLERRPGDGDAGRPGPVPRIPAGQGVRRIAVAVHRVPARSAECLLQLRVRSHTGVDLGDDDTLPPRGLSELLGEGPRTGGVDRLQRPADGQVGLLRDPAPRREGGRARVHGGADRGWGRRGEVRRRQVGLHLVGAEMLREAVGRAEDGGPGRALEGQVRQLDHQHATIQPRQRSHRGPQRRELREQPPSKGDGVLVGREEQGEPGGHLLPRAPLTGAAAHEGARRRLFVTRHRTPPGAGTSPALLEREA